MLRAARREAERLLLEGAHAAAGRRALDRVRLPDGAVRDGRPRRPRRRLAHPQGARGDACAEIADALVRAGPLRPEDRRRLLPLRGAARARRSPDPEVETTDRRRARAGSASQRRTIDDEEIVERLVFPLVNEGARILEEGIAYRAGDIDVVWVYGYGFPVWRGGPMFYADQVGLPYLLRPPRRLCGRARTTRRYEPAPLLTRLAREGRASPRGERGRRRDAPPRAAFAWEQVLSAERAPGMRRSRSRPCRRCSIAGLARSADRAVFDFRDRAITYRELAQKVDRLAAALPCPRHRAGHGRRAVPAEHALPPDRLLRLHEGRRAGRST